MSGDRYKIAGSNGVYYLTLTVAEQVDTCLHARQFFARKDYRYTIVDPLIYCVDIMRFKRKIKSSALQTRTSEGFKETDEYKDLIGDEDNRQAIGFAEELMGEIQNSINDE